MSNRVLHYLLGCCDPESKAEFDRILAAPDAQQDLKKLLKSIPDSDQAQKIAKLIEKRGKQSDGTFWQKLLHGPLKKGTLDLSPEELDRILKTPRDPAKQTKFEIYLIEYFRPDTIPSSDTVQRVVSDIKTDHELEIDELKYDPETTRLIYGGDKEVATQLLEKIGFKDATKVLDRELWYAKQKGTKRVDESAFLKFSIPLDRFGTQDPWDLKESLQGWLESEGLSDKTATVSDQEKALLFTGKVTNLKNLIYNFRLEPSAQADLLRNLANFMVK